MRTLTPTACAALALAAACLWAMPARAGQSYDNCTGTSDTLPAIISAEGRPRRFPKEWVAAFMPGGPDLE